MSKRILLPIVVATAIAAVACGTPPPRTACGTGTHADGSVCEPNNTDAGAPVTCGIGTHAVGDTCVANDVMYADGGLTDPTTWRANVRVSIGNALVAAEPQMAVDSHGTIFVACMVRASVPGWGVRVYRSSDGGSTFSEMETRLPSTSSEFLGDVTIAVDRSDRLFFGWIHYHEDAGGELAAELMMLQSQDGLQFGEVQQVSASDADNVFTDRPWLSLAPDGSMYVSWTGGASKQTGVGNRYARSVDGQPFDAPQTIFDSILMGEELGESPLAFDADGNPVAIATIYEAGPGGQISYSIDGWRMENGGWVDGRIASLVYEPQFTFETYAQLASDSHGVVTAMYLDGVSRVIAMNITRSTDGGRTWSTPVPVRDPRAPASTVALPWITHDETDRIHLMWLDNRYGNWVPYTAYSTDGVTFSPPERVGDAQFVEDGDRSRWIGDFVSLIVRDGARYAVWTDSRSGTSQVYFSVAPAP